MCEVVPLSQNNCEEIISKRLKSDDFEVVSFQQNRFEQVNGYLGDHFSLKIVITQDCEEETHHFFVKSLPSVPSQRNFLLEVNGFFKEKQFFARYLTLLKEYSIDVLDDAIPRCFLTTDQTFVFEDLAIQGYKTFPSRVPLSNECVEAALASLAKLHASCLILEEKKCFRLIDEFEEEVAETFYSDKKSVTEAWGSAKQGVKALIDLTHNEKMKICKDEFKKRAVDGFDQQKHFCLSSKKFRNTICHADPWTKNFMFKFENDEVKCVVVDFQTYRYAPPGQDVMAFLYLTTNRITREESLEEFLRFYYDELDRNFNKFGCGGLISEDEFFESCRYYKQFALVQKISHFQVVIMSDEIAEEVFSDPAEAKYVLFENKYDFMVESCRRDSIFRRLNFEVIEELREMFEENLK